MQPVTLNAADVSMWVGRLWWPMLRVGGFVLAAPTLSETVIPGRIKIIMSLALAFLMAPLVRIPAALTIFSGAGLLAAAQELLIGVAIGLVVQLTFEALIFAGQSISLAMGLGFATLVDPQRGANTTVLGQMFMIFGLLTYLAINGHLVLLGALAESFQTLPIAAAQLNLFGIGFTITLMCGFFVLIAGLDGIMTGISGLINSALMAAAELVG